MINKPKFFKVLSTLAVSTLLLSACGGSGGSEKTSSTKKVDTNKFSASVKNDKKEIKDGSLTYGLVSNTPFEGLLNFAVYEGILITKSLQFSMNLYYQMTKTGNTRMMALLHMKFLKIKKQLH